MKYSYRKIKYYTKAEAEREADRLNGEARRECMAGVHHEAEEIPGGWVVNKYVLRSLSNTFAKNGNLPHDHDPGYREGYIASPRRQ